MKTLTEQDVFDKQFAVRLAMLIESGLIDAHFYEPWTDDIITNTPVPPDWILDLTPIKDSAKAVELIREYVFSHTETIHPRPEPTFERSVYIEESIACLYLKYKRGELSWASFLDEAGGITDAAAGELECEYFYYRLHDLKMSLFSKSLEAEQRASIEQKFAASIAEMEPLYQGFEQYFKRNGEVQINP